MGEMREVFCYAYDQIKKHMRGKAVFQFGPAQILSGGQVKKILLFFIPVHTGTYVERRREHRDKFLKNLCFIQVSGMPVPGIQVVMHGVENFAKICQAAARIHLRQYQKTLICAAETEQAPEFYLTLVHIAGQFPDFPELFIKIGFVLGHCAHLPGCVLSEILLYF